MALPKPYQRDAIMPDSLNRAHRYPVAAPFRYRAIGETEWRAGKVVNVSSTGVLFSAEATVRPGMAIEMCFSLPPAKANAGGAQVISSGFVVRTDDSADGPQLAARFHHYVMARGTLDA